VKGANSTLYGASAASGVIFITTRKANTEKIAARISASVGTHQTADDQNFKTNGLASYQYDLILKKGGYSLWL